MSTQEKLAEGIPSLNEDALCTFDIEGCRRPAEWRAHARHHDDQTRCPPAELCCEPHRRATHLVTWDCTEHSRRVDFTWTTLKPS